MAGPAGGTNPIKVIDDNPMSVRQWIVVAIMVFLNALDGFDVLSSAFAAPGISAEWGIPRDELGIMLSAELVGMGFGSVILGGFADKAGRTAGKQHGQRDRRDARNHFHAGFRHITPHNSSHFRLNP